MSAELDTLKQQLSTLHADWSVDQAKNCLSRRFTFKGFNDGVSLANLCAQLAERENHHPDVAFGWGYCQVNYTTHSAGSITEKDISSARKLDELTTILGFR